MIFNIKFVSAILVALQCSMLVTATPFPQEKKVDVKAPAAAAPAAAAPAAPDVKAAAPADPCPTATVKTLTGTEKSCEDIAKEFGTDVATLLKLNVGKEIVCAGLKSGKIKPAELKDEKLCVPKKATIP